MGGLSKSNKETKKEAAAGGSAEVELPVAVTDVQERVRSGKKRRTQEDSEGVGSDCAAAVDTTTTRKKRRSMEKTGMVEPAAGSPVVDADRPEAEAAESPEAFRARLQISCVSGDELPDPVQHFAAAPFSKKTRAALSGAGFAAPTAVQAQGWPVVVQGSDMIAVAKTGSGKTLAFLLPIFRKLAKENLDASEGPAALVLAPTRELAMQIEEAAAKFGKCVGASSLVVYGGVPKPPQAKALRERPQLLVATPGRLVDLMNDGAVELGKVRFLVLDEADRMLDMGFEPQMKQVMEKIPSERQTLLFSATWPKGLRKLAAQYLKKGPTHLNVGETEELAANKAVSQQFFKLSDDEKESKLWSILNALSPSEKVIVFANTKRRIDNLQKAVWASGYDCVAMHGEKSQRERDAGLAKFVSGETQTMFATDVCARGLDIHGVTHVLNFDMARDVESYIHRIGRTGRAGASGTSITFFNEDYDMECAPALLKIAEEAGQSPPEFLKKAAAKGGKGKNKLWRY